jgi:hypothetical protein
MGLTGKPPAHSTPAASFFRPKSVDMGASRAGPGAPVRDNELENGSSSGMKALAFFAIVAGAAACGASQAQPTTPASNPPSTTSEPSGATNAQASDDPNRALTQSECDELGQYISGVCHENHSRQSRIEGWCSDVVSRQTAGTWDGDCVKSVKYMDSVCFRSADNAPAMMACDRSVDH